MNKIMVKLDWDLPTGVGVFYDEDGALISMQPVPYSKPPRGARTMVLGVEDYTAVTRLVKEGALPAVVLADNGKPN